MTDLSDMQAAALDVLEDLGTACTLTAVTATWANGATTETTVSYTAYCYVDESQDYASADTPQRAVGTMYVSASGLAMTPKVSDRVTYKTRTFGITAVVPLVVEAGVAAWQMSIAEMGAA